MKGRTFYENCILDAKTIGDDIDLSGFDSLGEITKYNFTTPEEAPERVKDADVLIINKVPINKIRSEQQRI